MPTDPGTSSSTNFVARWKNSSRRAHALLFAGPEGAGKRTAAQAIAADVLKTDSQTHPDLIRIAPEKNSIKIESIRELIGRVSLKPIQSERMVVVVEEADAMTTGAANALLKTLEEPPPYVLFLLLTSRPEELPATIRSRCQRVRFQIAAETLRQNLEALYASWTEELAPLWNPTRAPFASASRFAETLADQKERLPTLWDLLKALWHDLGVLSCGGAAGSLLIPSAQTKLTALTSRKDPDRIFEEMDLILETERALDGNVNKTLALERLFYKLIG
jgi:DNA polymerase III delta subunit-like protein